MAKKYLLMSIFLAFAMLSGMVKADFCYNSTSSTWVSPSTFTNVVTDAGWKWGDIINITTQQNILVLNVQKVAFSDAGNCSIYAEGNAFNLIATNYYVGDNCTLTAYLNQTFDTLFNVVDENWTGSRHFGYDYAGESCPMVSDNFNVVGWVDYHDGGDYPSFNCNGVPEIKSITSENTIKLPSNITLYLNGNMTNLTAFSNDTINITALMDITGVNYTLYENDAYLNSSIQNLSWVGSLSAGLYNFTANWSGNSTYSASSSDMLWINVTNPPAIYNGSSGSSGVVWNIAELRPNNVYCSDNVTETDVYTDANVTRNINCAYGCENSECNPSPIIQGSVILSLIVGISLGYYIIRKIRYRS